ncbi:MAG: cobalamin biosynthesis protein CobW [Clostridiales bacterium]|nr:cobalamin biosynthesis protein CobW [Clostridiales bacterium]
MTKIDIISGFLGAGKTTFIRKLLQEAIAGEQVVLIENEFGEIGIDGGFLKDAGIEIREMNSGCICCSLVGDFGKSLEEVLTKYQPDRVIIEPSGVGKLSDVMNAVRNVAKNLDVKLNSAVTVVDAAKCKMYMKNFGEFFNNQVENAGTIVLSRTDIADAAKVEQAAALLREHNATASIVTTPIDQLSGAQLLELIEKPDTMMEELLAQVKEEHEHHHDHCGCGCEDHEHHHHDHGDHEHEHHHDHDGHDHDDHEHHHHEHEDHDHGHEDHDHDHHDHEHHHHHHHHDGDHDADEIFESWGMEMVGPIGKEKLETILKDLAYGDTYGDVLRAKGMLPGEKQSEWYYFDLVPEQYEIRTGAPDYTGKACVIGANLKEDALDQAFGRN